MSILSELKLTISKVAPLLGSALGGPMGQSVGALIAAGLGSVSSEPLDLLTLINKNPESLLKLKEIELTHQQELFKIAASEYAIEVDDRKSARDMSGRNEWQTFVLAAGYLLFFIATCMLEMLGYARVNPELQGTLTMIAVMVGAFYFGSSKGERSAAQG